MMKTILSMWCIVLWCAVGNVIPRLPEIANIGLVTHFDGPSLMLGYEPLVSIKHLSSRASRPKCKPPAYGSSHARRSTDGNVASPSNQTLWRRMILPAEGQDMNRFMLDEIGKRDTFPLIWEASETTEKGGKNIFDVNNARYLKYDTFSGGVSFATEDLVGCTMLAIISRTGAYIAHYWESISFDTDADYTALWEKYETQEEIFKATILDGLEKGEVRDRESLQDPLQGQAANQINDASVRGFLIRPSYSAEEDAGTSAVGYRKQWDQIKEKVNSYIPELQQPNRWQEILHDPLDKTVEADAQILDTTARGKLLFKYDPKHPVAPKSRQKTSMVKLWSETTELHSDTWPAPILK